MKVPFNDLALLHHSIGEEIGEAIKTVIDGSGFVLSKAVSSFEQAFAKKLGVGHCIGVGNGTDALSISIKMLGIGAGDEVIVPANSFIATSEAVSISGATPVFADCDSYYGLCPNALKTKITSRTKAVIVVHLYGQAADIESISAICNDAGLIMLEDCAQSHFSSYKHSYTGCFGEAACYSFYPGKNLGALGDGGCIVTNNHNLAEKIRMYCNHGSMQHQKHVFEGSNSRLDGIQAAILEVKLKYIDNWNRQRLELAEAYTELLKINKHIVCPEIRPGAGHIFHLYVVRAQKRDELLQWLFKHNVQCGLHYEKALPFLPCYQQKNHSPAEFPVASEYQHLLLSLPIYPGMTAAQLKYTTNCIGEFYSQQ